MKATQKQNLLLIYKHVPSNLPLCNSCELWEATRNIRKYLRHRYDSTPHKWIGLAQASDSHSLKLLITRISADNNNNNNNNNNKNRRKRKKLNNFFVIIMFKCSKQFGSRKQWQEYTCVAKISFVLSQMGFQDWHWVLNPI